VHASPSSTAGAGPGLQVPAPSQVSSPLQGFASPQAVPVGTFVWEHSPVWQWSPVQTFPSSQSASATQPVQPACFTCLIPLASQESFVQGSPSSTLTAWWMGPTRGSHESTVHASPSSTATGRCVIAPAATSHLSTVQASPSSITAGVWVMPPGVHASAVQGSPSSTLTAWWTTPVAGTQASLVQTSPSSSTGRGLFSHLPALQVSSPSQRFASAQLAPSAFGANVHFAPAPQTSSVHGLPSSQSRSSTQPVQPIFSSCSTPLALSQVSNVHGSPSPSGRTKFTGPPSKSHRSTVQALPSSTINTSWTAMPVAASQRSAVHGSPSSMGLAGWVTAPVAKLQKSSVQASWSSSEKSFSFVQMPSAPHASTPLQGLPSSQLAVASAVFWQKPSTQRSRVQLFSSSQPASAAHGLGACPPVPAPPAFPELPAAPAAPLCPVAPAPVAPDAPAPAAPADPPRPRVVSEVPAFSARSASNSTEQPARRRPVPSANETSPPRRADRFPAGSISEVSGAQVPLSNEFGDLEKVTRGTRAP
jgi:hypothetical protein